MTTPIFNPDRGFSVWLLPQIYTGPTGTGRIVPNVDDAVLSWEQGWFRVDYVNPTTYESTLDPVDFNKMNGGVIAEDVLLSSGPNTYSESFRIHVNNNANPISVNFDGRLFMNTDTAHHVKIFRGMDITGTGHVISAIFNVSNVLISEDIPMVYTIMPTGTNVGTKAPGPGSLIEPLNHGEVCTAVFYNAANEKLSVYRVIADLGDFVHTVDLGKRYVIGISLLSNYLSVSDDHLLEVPVNIPLTSIALQGRVHYNDGTHLDLPVDGNRFSVLGLSAYVPSYQGCRGDLVLKYKLQPDEYGYGVTGVLSERFFTEDYKVTAIQRHAAYDVKLFVLPTWDTGTGTWSLKYYLYNLDRDQFWDATAHVTTTTSSGLFSGSLLDTSQILTVVVNLADVDASFDFYQYTQRFTISLRASGSNNAASTYWVMQYQTGTFVGSNLHALGSPQPGIPGQYRLNISQNLSQVNDWLQTVYWPTLPLRHIETETEAPTPTHVRVVMDGLFIRELTVDDALDYIENITSPMITGLTVRLEFFKRTVTTDYELGMVCMNIKQ